MCRPNHAPFGVRREGVEIANGITQFFVPCDNKILNNLQSGDGGGGAVSLCNRNQGCNDCWELSGELLTFSGLKNRLTKPKDLVATICNDFVSFVSECNLRIALDHPQEEIEQVSEGPSLV